MKYELRCGTRNGKYFIDKVEAEEGFTILTETQGAWKRDTVQDLEDLIDQANEADELKDYVLYIRSKIELNEMPLTIEEYRELNAICEN